MGSRIFLPGPHTSGLEAQVLGPNSNEALSQVGRETIQIACAANVQGPLWSQRKFHCRDGFCRYHHLIAEDLQIRRFAVFAVFAIKER